VWIFGIWVSWFAIFVGGTNIILANPFQIWELLFAEHLFGSDNEEDSLALMITYLGPPPAEFLERSEVSQDYFDEQGQPSMIWRVKYC